MLFLFRNIYAEVGTALPLNGGAYNALLNTTSKYRASIAACLTILSYMATACISGYEAMHYLHAIWHMPGGTVVATIVLLGIFMVLTFTTPDLAPTGKLVWAYVTYIGLTLAYTVNNVPYSALMGVMTPSPVERTDLSAWRFAGAFFGGFLAVRYLF